jgi:predicted nucleic-acid-binding protein
MSQRRLIDTNIIIRYLVGDNLPQAKAAAQLFEACDRGELRLVLLPSVLCECIYVLTSFYKHPRGEVARVLRGLVSHPGVELDNRTEHLDALDRFAKTKVDFVDCLLAATGAQTQTTVASFDRDLTRFTDVTVLNPLQP